MAIYNAHGNELLYVYDADRNELDYAYDENGMIIYAKTPSQDDSDDAYISGRTLLFEDKFETINTNNWGFELGRVRNSELQYYTNDGNNVEITEDNELCITAKRENYVNAQWTSASLTSFGKKEFKYGRFEAKIKFPSVTGSFPAFWTLGNRLILHYYADGTWMTHDSGNWPYCGENDIIEFYGARVTSGAYYSETDQQGVGQVSLARIFRTIDLTQYHIYAIEWTATSMTYYIDGVQTATFEITNAMAHAFREPHYIILNLAVGAAGGTPASSTTEMKMYVDWVRVYAPLDNAS